jgi:hypothetical protein
MPDLVNFVYYFRFCTHSHDLEGLHPSNQAYHSYPPSAFVMDREEASSGGRNLKVRYKVSKIH